MPSQEGRSLPACLEGQAVWGQEDFTESSGKLLLNHITVYSFHLAQVFTEHLLGIRCCAGNWGNQRTKQTGSLPQEPAGQGLRVASATARPGGCAGGSVLDPVVREGLSEEGAFEQSPNKMKGLLCKFCSQNIPGRGNSWEDD